MAAPSGAAFAGFQNSVLPARTSASRVSSAATRITATMLAAQPGLATSVSTASSSRAFATKPASGGRPAMPSAPSRYSAPMPAASWGPAGSILRSARWPPSSPATANSSAAPSVLCTR